MAKFFEDWISALPTMDYMDRVQDLKNLECRVLNIEREHRPGMVRNQTTSSMPVIANQRISEGREEAFLKAIRSFRIWLIDGSQDLAAKVDAFFKNALCMSQRDLDQIIVEDICTARSSPRSKQQQSLRALARCRN